jgi:hypothetical protein
MDSNMNDPWLDRWNDRYSKEEFAFGVHPNDYLKEQLEKLPIGKILFPAEGEGRNAVFAAKLGWTVSAFDISIEGKNNYAHFPADIKSSIHKTLDIYLRKGGYIIFEAFSKKHIDYITKSEKVGGPKDIASPFSIDEIKSDFVNYEIMELVEKEIELSQGQFHNGKGSVIRFVGRKR